MGASKAPETSQTSDLIVQALADIHSQLLQLNWCTDNTDQQIAIIQQPTNAGLPHASSPNVALDSQTGHHQDA